MDPSEWFVTREPGQGGIQDAPGAESENVDIEQEMFMPPTAEGAEEFLATEPPTKVRSCVGRIRTKAVINTTINVKVYTQELIERNIFQIFRLEVAREPCMRAWDLEFHHPPQWLCVCSCPLVA